MRDRGKREVEAYNNGGGEGFGEGFVEFPCKKHPASSSSISTGGICAYCLTDRLYQLVCPQCGEQRLSSSCSCSCATDNLFTSNHRNSTSSADVGSVGRISFLLENDKIAVNNNNYLTEVSGSKPKIMEQRSATNVDDFPTLRRSNSTCVGDVNYTTSSGSGIGRKESKEKFWKFGRLFRKKREKPNNHIHNNNFNNNLMNNHDQENGNYECNGVSRSRSLCSFRGFYDTEESGNFPVSSSSAARASSVSTGNFYADSAKMSCFSESEARISNFDYFDANGFLPNKNNHNNNSIFSMKETEFMSCDDPAYIDLKLHDVSDQVPNKVPDLAGLRRSGLGMSTKEFSFRGGGGADHHHHQEMFRNGSCRRSSVTERELRKCRKSYKVWRWFFRHQNTSGGTDHHLHQDQHHHQNHHHYDAYNS